MVVLMVTIEAMAAAAGEKSPSEVARMAFVCPSVCPSDWDKQKTLAVKDASATLYGERSKSKRRGQDSNLRYSLTRTPV